jgi:hypothetical protein
MSKQTLTPHRTQSNDDLDPRLARYRDAYLAMAKEVRYRPQAPNDGRGHITLTEAQCSNLHRLHQEAVQYALRFDSEENTRSFSIGCSNFCTNKAFIWTIEAARLLAAGLYDDVAVQLMKMAIREIKRERDLSDD